MKNDQRPQGCAGEHDSSMSSLKPNCALLQWAALQNHLSPHLQGVLLRLVSLMGDDGSLSLSQTAIAPLINMGERQTRAAIKELVSEGLIKRTRQGAVGRGRAPDRLSANVDTGDIPPVSVNSHNGETGEQSPPPHEICDNGHIGGPSPVSVQICDNGDNAAMSPVSVILDAEFVDNSPAPYKGTGARADKLTLNTLSTEIYSEPTERASTAVALIAAASSDSPPPPKIPAWQRVADAVRSPWLDPNKSIDLAMHGKKVQRWIDAGADELLDVIPTVERLCERKGEAISTWNYFEKAVIDAARKRKASELPLELITAEATHDQRDRPASTYSPQRRRARSVETEILMRDILDGTPERVG